MTRQTMLDKPGFTSWARDEFMLTRAELSALPHDDLEEVFEQWCEYRAETISVLEFFCD